MRDMTFLTCGECGQSYFGPAGVRRRRRCALCGGPLRRDAPARPHRPLPAEPPPILRAAPGSFPDDPRRYASLVDFALADLRRVHSRERDLGLTWRDADRMHRAAFVVDTRELYLVQLGPVERGGGHVELLGRLPAALDLVATFRGWAENCGLEDSLRWLRARAERALAW